MSSSFNPLYRYEVPSLKSATRKMKLDFTRPFVSRMKKIKKTKLSQDETALAIKLTHRAGNPENNKLEESEIVGYPFLIGLKTPLTCEGLYREVYVFFFSGFDSCIYNTHTRTDTHVHDIYTKGKVSSPNASF